ncbi:hypothetical protein BC939DRAFT_137191 [Gamsiella multidivaricata]|uniref:uncharacterized protein n=1 Tax=Gamsiella multidivaricata TaxID=101098 RepID=UPI002220651F|nr:uncharacterized protein BC939DRAFT_137191 [Gamsiella multidivaricata]KAG0368942.1 hypothetical protein BGZ54_000746 [Gamsiella multidivaricata]KAI7824610.1 hypothetical protein BC939DRAFT_137191 [Gamsiella multidivaricata]
MALESNTTSSSYPTLSNSLSSFLSTLQCNVDEPSFSSSSIPLDPYPPTNSQTPVQDSIVQRDTTATHTLSQLNLSLDNSLCSAALPGCFQMLENDIQQNDPVVLLAPEQKYGVQGPCNVGGWEAEQLRLLLGIADHDIEAPCPIASRTVNIITIQTEKESDIQPFSMTDIKKPDVKEAFIHPGFYSLSSSSTSTSSSSLSSSSSSSSPSMTPLMLARKRPLQEEGSFDTINTSNKRTDSKHSLQAYATELRRYSLDGHLPTKATTWIYGTLPMSPSSTAGFPPATCASYTELQHQDMPPGQPYMATFSSSPLLLTLGQEVLPSLHMNQTQLTRFQSSLAKTASTPGTPPQQRKRRTSKHKTDQLFPVVSSSSSNYPGIQDGSQYYTVNAVPPPLQNHHHHQPYVHQPPYTLSAKQARTHQYQRQQSHPFGSHGATAATGDTRLGNRGTSSYRRNPGEVPASTLPPDHFVFQEALLTMVRGSQAQSISLVNLGAATAAAAAVASNDPNHGDIVSGRRRSEPANIQHRTHSVVSATGVATETTTAVASDGLCAPKKTSCHPVAVQSSCAPSEPSLSSHVTKVRPSTAFDDRWPDYAMTLGIGEQPVGHKDIGAATTTEVASEAEAEAEVATEAATKAAATTTPTTPTITAVPEAAAPSEEEDKESPLLSVAAAFAQSLSTVTTLDPAATKLIDQLRLQEYLRTVGPSSSSSMPSTIATSIAASSSLF